MRTLVACLGLVSLLLSGCGTSNTGTTEAESQNVKKDNVAASSPAARGTPTDSTSTTADATSADAAASSTDPAPAATTDAQTTAKVAEASEAAGTEQAAAKEVNKYPYEAVVAAAGEPRLTHAYKDFEDALRKSPHDPEHLMRKTLLLATVGKVLADEAKEEQASQAFRAAYEPAQKLVNDGQELPDGFKRVLAKVYYHGARGDAVDGEVEAARSALQQAVEWGWDDVDAIQNNADLASVRALPGFQEDLQGWMEASRQAFHEQAREDLANGETFPFDFELTTIAGKPLQLADLKGQVVIVDIWGTWCPPCREEVPSFIKLQEQYGKQGLQIVGVNYEQGAGEAENKLLVKDFIEANGINYPCALGTEELAAQVPNFGGFPTVLFLDHTGTVRLKVAEAHEYAYLEGAALALLEEMPADKAPES